MKGKNAPWILVTLIVDLGTIGALSFPIPAFSMFPVNIIDPPVNRARGEVIK